MAAPRPPRLRRRGGPAIEFALVLPVFVLLLGGIFEFSWFFFMRAITINAVQAGCRAGAVVPPDESPTIVAEDEIGRAMGAYSFWGADCSDPDDSQCEMNVATSGSSPTELITCSVAMEYRGLTGLVPMPTTITAGTTRIFEVQR